LDYTTLGKLHAEFFHRMTLIPDYFMSIKKKRQLATIRFEKQMQNDVQDDVEHDAN